MQQKTGFTVSLVFNSPLSQRNRKCSCCAGSWGRISCILCRNYRNGEEGTCDWSVSEASITNLMWHFQFKTELFLCLQFHSFISNSWVSFPKLAVIKWLLILSAKGSNNYVLEYLFTNIDPLYICKKWLRIKNSSLSQRNHTALWFLTSCSVLRSTCAINDLLVVLSFIHQKSVTFVRFDLWKSEKQSSSWVLAYYLCAMFKIAAVFSEELSKLYTSFSYTSYTDMGTIDLYINLRLSPS